ncbi:MULTISPECIES: FtsW/RodA/SpoVE family cell cycle protein [Atopobiaceae]|uniref:Rod shape determining protein RodA n=1 Tax=Parafannyhessea umbonata TaxID=604330 RepID=A0A1H9NUF6_9ACTN|nr:MULTISPECIES: FtsW/RodA/SpoVE family cell cycle protein [Atopobiaceae]SEH58126.1 rod shape determining protein RodA [Parafannyhessea umbonata]SER39600.1 rod shape determining protein RodA [Parafannyhessea umbonata]SJZ51414.1 rod shape determining protein RodA [Olsenella sp. KH1P3]
MAKPAVDSKVGEGGLGSFSAFYSHIVGRRAPRASSGKLSRGPFFLPQLIPALLLVVYGSVVIYTASLTIADASFVRHLVGVAMGAAGALAIWHYDYRAFANMSKALLITDAVLMLLPSVPGLGYSALGMTGWIKIPLIGMTFQPSELAKLVTIYLMASLGAEYNGRIETLRDYVKLCAILCIPFGLIMTQPDLGTGLIILVTGAAIIICSGAKRTWVLVTIALIVVGAALIVATSLTDGLPHLLKQYQLKRLIVFVDPSVDPAGDGYNLQQAKIAVGSGGFFGKGFGNATQAGSGFLPEAHTDFVFALLSEEFGFVGAVALLALFGAMIFTTVGMAQRIDAPFGKLVLAGVATMWSFQLLQNVGMCIGIMPITGIPLPFISFGSSSMLAQMTAIGMVQSVWHHRPKAA